MADLSSCVGCGLVVRDNTISVKTNASSPLIEIWPYPDGSIERNGAPVYCDSGGNGRIFVDPSPRLPFYVTAEGSITYNAVGLPDYVARYLYQPVSIPNPSACLPCIVDFIWTNETSFDIASNDRIQLYLSSSVDFTNAERVLNYQNPSATAQINTGWTLARRETVILQPGETYEANLAVSGSVQSPITKLRRIEFNMKGTCTVIGTV